MVSARVGIDFAAIKKVEVGRTTASFMESTAKNDDCCFSLVTSNHVYDFEANSKAERDALVDGFVLMSSGK